MKREAFISLLNTIQNFVKTSEQFGQEIAQAYRNAGAERDFTDSFSYEIPHGHLIDDLVEGIALSFETETYSATAAEDTINWWIWETNYGKGMLEQYVDDPTYPHVEYNQGSHKEFVVKTPNDLYDVLMYEQALSSESNSSNKQAII